MTKDSRVNAAPRAGAATPPRSPIAFRVGVVGHRPDRLPASDQLEPLRARIAAALGAVASAVERFASGPDAAYYDTTVRPILTACSPLAEGADRIFAEEALRLGYRLNCIMPFSQDAFEQDFEGPQSIEHDSLARFRSILEDADRAGGLTRFEMNGHREHALAAYEATGRVVLNQSDLLVAIWDGAGANGLGGTVGTLREALAFGVPTLWIDSRAPHNCKFIEDADDLDYPNDETACVPSPTDADSEAAGAAIAVVVEDELATPGVEPGISAAATNLEHLETYLGEVRPAFNFAFTWKLFRDFLDQDRIRLPALRVTDYVQQVLGSWPADGDPGLEPPGPGPGISWINRHLRAHYAWSDKLADHYADAHRSGFVLSSLLAATAVLTGILPVAAQFGQDASMATAIVEAVILVIIVTLPAVARRGRWHQKWLEYRVLAEMVRELRILIPLGGARPSPRTPAHLANYGDPTQSWMSWQARAIARAVGLPNARVDDAYIHDQVQDMLDFVGEPAAPGYPAKGQLGFHRLNCERMERIHHRLHRLSLILFYVTMAAVGVNWVQRIVWPEAYLRLGDWLILSSAFLPALAASFAAINNQGEFARLQRRSRAMADSLSAVRDQVAAMAIEARMPPLGAVAELAARIATMMVEENTEWRIVVLDLPHVAG